MALRVVNEGEVQLLRDLLAIDGTAGVVTLEAWTLKLFSNNYTPVEPDTSANYTEATFTGYTSKPLIREGLAGHWSAPAAGAATGAWTTEASVAEATYAAQSWTALSAQTIYGYYVVGATSGKVIWAERFVAAQVLAINDVLTFTPRLGIS